jgi:hypothetical protein
MGSHLSQEDVVVIINSELSNLANQVTTLSTNTVEVKTNLHKLVYTSTKLFQTGMCTKYFHLHCNFLLGGL